MTNQKKDDDSKSRSVVTISPRDIRNADENPYTTIARKLTRPEVTSAAVIQVIEGENHNINALITQLAEQVAAVNAGDMSRPEAMLVAQAHTLDGLFSRLARRAVANMDAGHIEAGERYLRLALKAQSQCRSTVESLAEIKNPRPVAFIRQGNFSNGPQQVNNGLARAGEIENQPNKVLEHQHGERLDFGATSEAGGADTDLEAVGAVNRTEDGRG